MFVLSAVKTKTLQTVKTSYDQLQVKRNKMKLFKWFAPDTISLFGLTGVQLVGWWIIFVRCSRVSFSDGSPTLFHNNVDS